MKKVLLLLTMVLAVASADAQTSQIDFNDPQYARWGDTAEAREKNMLTATFMKEAFDNKDYDGTAHYLQEILANAPAASEPVYARAVNLYRGKINRSKSLSEKRMMVDSLMLIHDMRLEYFGDHPSRGRIYILDGKARDYFNYNRNDREGLREVFRLAIEESGSKIDIELVLLYFNNLVEDYKLDEIMADEVIAEYDRLTPFFAQLEDEQQELRNQFDTAFGNSGVASCENLETIFKEKLASTPDDERVLSQAVKLMGRAGCRTPFYTEVAESYYRIHPTSAAAVELARIFQNDGDFEKASKFLRDVLERESDVEEQEKLYARIAWIELAAGRMSSALAAARSAVAIPDGTEEDNGVALFVIAQVYGNSAVECSGLDQNIAYLAAYDMMERAIRNLSSEEATGLLEPAKTLLGQYKAYFPTKEECFFNEIEVGSSMTVECGVAKGTSTKVRTRD